jgi:hypothetical protein
MADWRAELQALVDEANAVAKNLSVDVEVATVSRPDTLGFRDAAKLNVKDPERDLRKAREHQLRDYRGVEKRVDGDGDGAVQEALDLLNGIVGDPDATGFADHVVVPTQASRVISIGSQRDEIGQHVAKFKAHQQRLIMERQDFAARELQRMRASAFDQRFRHLPSPVLRTNR